MPSEGKAAVLAIVQAYKKGQEQGDATQTAQGG
jgi:hypothetical protein